MGHCAAPPWGRGDAAKIAGYCGKSEELDDALADFAGAYDDQTEQDHALLVKAIKAGKIPAFEEEERGAACARSLVSGSQGMEMAVLHPVRSMP